VIISAARFLLCFSACKADRYFNMCQGLCQPPHKQKQTTMIPAADNNATGPHIQHT
jgi:hypothetical protein